ncbi:hypothetical protein CR983_02060 [Candidatus Saccharibacteria bacterium]|nr:MAG: hypothetical protein CR983_02060 [Candidatus Saccharibacteria bacterium]
MQKLWWLLAGSVVMAALAVGWMVLSSLNTPATIDSPQEPLPVRVALKPGRYIALQEGALQDEAFDRTILFFYERSSAEARAFDGEISQASDTLPKGTQIIRVDVATKEGSQLYARHGEQLMPSFAAVRADGSRVSLWSAYGQTKTVQAILDNT